MIRKYHFCRFERGDEMSIFESFFDHLEKEQVIGLSSPLQAVYLYQYWKEYNVPLLLVTSSLYEANQLFQLLNSYTDSVFLFPMDDFLTSEALAISPELMYTRLETLQKITEQEQPIVVTNLMGYLRYLPSRAEYEKQQLILNVQCDYPREHLLTKLIDLGYTRETIVSKTGEMAVRGFVIDVFPVGESVPVRFEFWGDTIDSIRTFDPESQLTIAPIASISIRPNTEFFIPHPEGTLYRNLPQYTIPFSIQSYASFQIAYIDYQQLKISNELLTQQIFEYNVGLNLDPTTSYMHDFDTIKPQHPIYFETFDNILPSLSKAEYKIHPLEPFPKGLEDLNKALRNYIQAKKTLIICFKDRYQMNRLLDSMDNPYFIVTSEEEIFEQKINLIVRPLEQGFCIHQYMVVNERELFSKKGTRIEYKSNFKYGSKIQDITKLNVGDYVVHNIHGIGRYLGLKTLEKNHLKKDYLMIEYKDGDKLYIPVEKIELIHKYSSNEGAVPKLNKLGSLDWEKTKLRVRKKIEDIAGELLKLYAERESSVGFSFLPDDEAQLQFEREFPYEDTVDQRKVTEEIKREMESPHPMDRLLCGDVGYGKTEVAFRAIMKAILSGKQAAFLCPTTILSKQHYQNALERFRNTGASIALLNRFVSTKKVREVLQGIEKGTIDLVIGTHRILSDDLHFKDLGLLIVDEEQRFGVKHKEKMKQLKKNIDVLTLSATPIPRTLQMSMTGVRSLSLIETPPTNRYPVQTYVLAENKNIIKDAIYKELSRDGQIFILYNRIDDMAAKVTEMQRLVPNARIISAHGRMNKRELEEVMLKFTEHEYDVLLCTTIIETGIDIPSVNTLIIMDADHFGLSQLYQIRGRVGRSNKIAYCYLMYHSGKSLSDVATKRLSVIKEFTELGSGFSIAMRDLAIRGAGDILGSEQAGFVDSVGIELYLHMLNEEVNRLKGIPVKEESTAERALLEVATAIEDSYVDDNELKIEIHKKINEIDSYDTLLTTKKELEDRFGMLSESLLVYMYEEWFEKLAFQFHITQIRQTKNFIEFVLPKELTEQVNGELLFLETMRLTKKFRFSLRHECLVITLDLINLEKHFIYYLVEFMEVLEKSITKKEQA